MVERRGKRTKGEDLPILYPEFGARVDFQMKRWGLKNVELGKLLGFEKGEMVRRYRRGQARPDDDATMHKMAVAFQMTPGELHYGDPKVPGVTTVPVADVSPDEQILLEAYRKMPEGAKKVLRVRATELAEEFAPASEAVPFGKGRRKK